MTGTKPSTATVKGCRLLPAWYARQPEAAKAMMRERVKDKRYAHLYPCPKANGWWGYKTDCADCGNAIRETAEA